MHMAQHLHAMATPGANSQSHLDDTLHVLASLADCLTDPTTQFVGVAKARKRLHKALKKAQKRGVQPSAVATRLAGPTRVLKARRRMKVLLEREFALLKARLEGVNLGSVASLERLSERSRDQQ